MEKIVQILNEQGVHARPASIFAKTASKFKSTISIVQGNRVANAKSIINIMSLGLKKDEEIKLNLDSKIIQLTNGSYYILISNDGEKYIKQFIKQ